MTELRNPAASQNRRRRSRNQVTIEQLQIACGHVQELRAAGMTENLAIRTLELLTDVYAKLAAGGSATPHKARDISRSKWSKAAMRILEENPNAEPRLHFVVEHGTPKRQLARLVMKKYEAKNLTEETMKSLCKDRWKLAVITREENSRLNRMNRSGLLGSAEERWTRAGIEFPSGNC